MKNGKSREDRLISNIMKDFKMESPSEGFTDKVMQTIQSEQAIPAMEPRPLINTAGWIGITVGLLVPILLLFLGAGNEVPSEASGWMQRLPSINLPSFDFQYNGLFSWINLSSSTLLWIFTGIGGIILLTFLERVFNEIRMRYFFV